MNQVVFSQSVEEYRLSAKGDLSNPDSLEDTHDLHLDIPGNAPEVLWTADEEFDPAEIGPDEENRLFRLYVREASANPLLTREDEIRLAREIEQAKYIISDSSNDCDAMIKASRQLHEARDLVIRSNLKLVIGISVAYQGRGLSRNDLIQTGNVGLIKSVDNFDYRKGCRFSTYATWCIRKTILRALVDQANTVRVPVYMADKLGRIKRTMDSVARQSREWDIGLLSELTGYGPDVIGFALSIEKSSFENAGIDGEAEAMEDPRCFSPETEAEQAEASRIISEVLKTLKVKEEKVIRMRFGIGEDRDHTLEEVSRHMNLTREGARQIEIRALRKLRHPSRIGLLRDLLS